MNSWKACKNILCVRADNMGDVIMSGPAFRAIKETFDCSLTLLTSSMGSLISNHIKEIDETIIFNSPWIKTADAVEAKECFELIQLLKEKDFDGVIIFTVYSQSSLPAALITLMAGIPLRLAYCRENPYSLLTHWVPDEEPYTFIQHQVERDLTLVKHIGAEPSTDLLSLHIDTEAKEKACNKLLIHGIDINQPFILFHPGVSEAKREYPVSLWAETIKLFNSRFKLPILITGSKKERAQAVKIDNMAENLATIIAGELTLEEFMSLVDLATVVVSVNTATVHIAAALQTPLIVLYALTNPQHTPWKTKASVLYFPVEEDLKSKNEIVKFVSERLSKKRTDFPLPTAILEAAEKLILTKRTSELKNPLLLK